MVGVVVLASPPRDPIQSKRHNGRRLQALHMYSAATPPPPRSSKVRWSGRWDQQHDGVVLMVESICKQGFAYAREVEEERLEKLVKLGQKTTRKRGHRLNNFSQKSSCLAPPWSSFYSRTALGQKKTSFMTCTPRQAAARDLVDQSGIDLERTLPGSMRHGLRPTGEHQPRSPLPLVPIDLIDR
jgi:hypothetical protein